MYTEAKTHYDMLTGEGNDPVYDPEPLKEYMSKIFDVFFCKMRIHIQR